MAGSLLDGDDFSSIGVSKAAKKSRGPTDNAMKAKIAVIVVCLGGAVGLYAWQSGMFDSKPKDTRTQEEIQIDEEEFQRQQKEIEEMRKLPEYQMGDA